MGGVKTGAVTWNEFQAFARKVERYGPAPFRDFPDSAIVLGCLRRWCDGVVVGGGTLTCLRGIAYQEYKLMRILYET